MSDFDFELIKLNRSCYNPDGDYLQLSVVIGGNTFATRSKIFINKLGPDVVGAVTNEIIRELTSRIGRDVAKKIFDNIESAGMKKIEYPATLAIKETK